MHACSFIVGQQRGLRREGAWMLFWWKNYSEFRTNWPMRMCCTFRVIEQVTEKRTIVQRPLRHTHTHRLSANERSPIRIERWHLAFLRIDAPNLYIVAWFGHFLNLHGRRSATQHNHTNLPMKRFTVRSLFSYRLPWIENHLLLCWLRSNLITALISNNYA